MSTGEVLANVTTPLALAALCVMAGTGFLKVVSQQKPSASLRLTIHWGFILALTLGVLANISYVAIASFGREIRIAGSVRDDSDRPLSRAIVDIPGRGRGITDDYGAFELSIPDSRKTDLYEGIVSLDGYGAQKFTLPGPVPKTTVSLSLKRPQAVVEDLILTPETVYIGHYLGMPQVNLKLRFFNPLPSRMHLENISVTLVGPNKRQVAMQMVGTYAPSGQFIPAPMSSLDLDKSQNWSLGYRFFLADQGANVLMVEAQKEYAPTLPVPQLNQIVFSSALADKFTAFMNRTMIWQPGSWDLIVGCMIDNRKLSRTFAFDMTAEDVQKMRSVSRFYRTGYSVMPMIPDAPDGSSNIAVSIR